MAKTMNIVVLDMPAANTEYSYEFPANVNRFKIKLRAANALRVSPESGKVAGATDPYYTVDSGTVFTESNLSDWKTRVLYFATGQVGQKLEIMYWTAPKPRMY